MTAKRRTKGPPDMWFVRHFDSGMYYNTFCDSLKSARNFVRTDRAPQCCVIYSAKPRKIK